MVPLWHCVSVGRLLAFSGPLCAPGCAREAPNPHLLAVTVALGCETLTPDLPLWCPSSPWGQPTAQKEEGNWDCEGGGAWGGASLAPCGGFPSRPLPGLCTGAVAVSNQHTNDRAVLWGMWPSAGLGVAGAGGGTVGADPPLTWASPAEESKRIPTPCHSAGPPRMGPSLLLSRVYHTACRGPSPQVGGHLQLPASSPLRDPGLGVAGVGGHSPCLVPLGALALSPSAAPPPPRTGTGQGPWSTWRRAGPAGRAPGALPPGPRWHLLMAQLRPSPGSSLPLAWAELWAEGIRQQQSRP